MLQKMGWKEGAGLGANLDGTTEHVKVSLKTDSAGKNIRILLWSSYNE